MAYGRRGTTKDTKPAHLVRIFWLQLKTYICFSISSTGMTLKKDTILVIGACGQLGSELTMELRAMYGAANVVAADIQFPKQAELRESGPFEVIDVLTPQHLADLAKKY